MSMLRNITRLASASYDLVVVGGGIYGACAAWEGALRGLRVALIDAGDFGGGTSGNSLRTLHGGLRHLQRLDFKRMRESIRERREWLRLAPHLARPLRFILPTHGQGLRGPLVMRAALWANDVVSADRNRGVRGDRRLPRGVVLSEAAARAALPGIELNGCNGAAAWHDAVCLDTERLLLSVVSAAADAGAATVNYVRATGLLARHSRIRGVRARDELSGREMELRAKYVINAAGPWVEDWLPAGAGRPKAPMFRASRAFNLLTRPLPFPDGVGLTVRAHGRSDTTYFILPWNGYSLIGTRHLRCDPSTRSTDVMREDVLAFVSDLNTVLGKHRLTGADVHGVFAGLLPEEDDNSGAEVALERDPQVIDHEPAGLRGLLSIVGVKWTIAPAVASKAVATACRLLGAGNELLRRPRKLAPMTSAFFEGPRGLPPLDRAVAAHLEQCYGAAHRHVLALIATEPALAAQIVPDLPVVLAQVAYAARAEMAVRLADVVQRRTPLYLSHALDRQALTACAATLARELRWSTKETGAQVDEAMRELAAFRGPLVCDLEPAAA
ncbi:MAG TPA: FAD-dependent oxidoreductase [Steroidobacteraceae bacterium]|jgi:glycerol-3-phosphate dehydrogenase|nr:FAD-dependent oxidoreductase [Steroidobacteraceae bacterium]